MKIFVLAKKNKNSADLTKKSTKKYHLDIDHTIEPSHYETDILYYCDPKKDKE